MKTSPFFHSTHSVTLKLIDASEGMTISFKISQYVKRFYPQEARSLETLLSCVVAFSTFNLNHYPSCFDYAGSTPNLGI